MLRNSGNYALTVAVDGKTFKREKTLKFTVREPFRVELAANELEGEFALTVIADDKRLRTTDVVLSAVITLPNGSEQALDLASDQVGVWRYEAEEQGTGSYTINLTASGYNSESTVVDYTLAEQSLYLNVPGISEPIVLPEPELKQDIDKEPLEKTETLVDASAEKEKKNSWLPYILLVAGNCLLIGLLFFIYKKMMSSSSLDSSSTKQAAPEKTMDNADAESNSPPIVEEKYKETDDAEVSEQETVDSESEVDDKPEIDSAEAIVEQDIEAVAEQGVEVDVKEGIKQGIEQGIDEDIEESIIESIEEELDTDNSKEDAPVDIDAIDIDAVDISVDEENDKKIDANLGALLDVDTELDDEDNLEDNPEAQGSNKEQATDKEEDVNKDEADISDDIDIEFDLSADDDLPEDKKT